MAFDVARVRGLHPSLGDGWVHFDAPAGMLIPEHVATTVSTAFRNSVASTASAHPSAWRSAAVLEAARQAVADLVNGDPRGVVLGADRAVLLSSLAERRRRGPGSATRSSSPGSTTKPTLLPGCAQQTDSAPRSNGPRSTSRPASCRTGSGKA
ncbi:cysteine desulfurase domain protein [Mycobacterium xenopi 4042]|uniref:Cysteine desulfurase domain protein n=1 Tax=Mycobacterium xenopi 4042 TaxID=1299334 RepID=X7ZHW6_MYCXE|nr:cysteine desulfurase domain protein [Mycobacterium xenopi 4042]